jgi:probable phosphoglycerate mutase
MRERLFHRAGAKVYPHSAKQPIIIIPSKIFTRSCFMELNRKTLLLGILVFIEASLVLAGCASTQSAGDQRNDGAVVIYLVRHGRTFFNTTGQVQGFIDSPLTDAGISQAKQVGKGMAQIKFTGAYSSDLGRQRHTAKLILAENAHETPELVELYGLREWNYGGFEGKTNAEMWDPLFQKYGLQFDENWTDYEKLAEMLGDRGIADAIAEADPLHAAENYDEIVRRSKEAMETIISETLAKGGGNVLAVSSGSEIPTILYTFVPEQYKGESIGNCTVTILEYKAGTYKLGVVGDKSYLQ